MTVCGWRRCRQGSPHGDGLAGADSPVMHPSACSSMHQATRRRPRHGAVGVQHGGARSLAKGIRLKPSAPERSTGHGIISSVSFVCADFWSVVLYGSPAPAVQLGVLMARCQLASRRADRPR